jgi:hypothetical protein
MADALMRKGPCTCCQPPCDTVAQHIARMRGWQCNTAIASMVESCRPPPAGVRFVDPGPELTNPRWCTLKIHRRVPSFGVMPRAVATVPGPLMVEL